jgi:hypothetical protein
MVLRRKLRLRCIVHCLRLVAPGGPVPSRLGQAKLSKAWDASLLLLTGWRMHGCASHDLHSTCASLFHASFNALVRLKLPAHGRAKSGHQGPEPATPMTPPQFRTRLSLSVTDGDQAGTRNS